MARELIIPPPPPDNLTEFNDAEQNNISHLLTNIHRVSTAECPNLTNTNYEQFVRKFIDILRKETTRAKDGRAHLEKSLACIRQVSSHAVKSPMADLTWNKGGKRLLAGIDRLMELLNSFDENPLPDKALESVTQLYHVQILNKVQPAILKVEKATQALDIAKQKLEIIRSKLKVKYYISESKINSYHCAGKRKGDPIPSPQKLFPKKWARLPTA
eukprot:sb/3470026/